MGHGPYTPPNEVVRLRKENSLLPASFADNGDFILLRDVYEHGEIESLPFFKDCESKNLNLINLADLHRLNGKIHKIVPWGWDHAIIRDLRDNGISCKLLPPAEKIEELRKLSHRRTTIPFREMTAKILNEELIKPPKEIFSIEEVENFLSENPVTYFKAPWSSSGRGIVVSDHITKKGLMEWCHGVIRHQGSVLAEPGWERIFDFATEWELRDLEATFLGVSVFETSSRGKYHGNINLPQSELYKLISEHVPRFNEDIINAQKYVLENLILPGYEGYIGIDMLAEKGGKINPCVELNLRLTMGHVALLRNQL